MSRVFFLAPIARFDVSPASLHGEITFLFDDPYTANPMSGQAAMKLISDRLDELRYNPTKDLVAQTGLVPGVSMLTLCASEFSDDGKVRILLFDARTSAYIERSITPLVG